MPTATSRRPSARRDGGRDVADADDRPGRRQQRDQCCRGGGRRGAGWHGERDCRRQPFNVTVTDNGVTKTYVATVNVAGTGWNATIPASDATALANGTATVSAQVTDLTATRRPCSQTRDGGRERPDADDRRGRRQQRHQLCRGPCRRRRAADRHCEWACRRQHLQCDGHRQWRDQDLYRHRERGPAPAGARRSPRRMRWPWPTAPRRCRRRSRDANGNQSAPQARA